jgi:CheY-like chemotaxis protein
MTAFRILQVDDEPDIRRVVELALAGDEAFTLRGCGSGEEAIAIALEWAPDLILCDVMMPVMDGPATLARLKENPKTADIPVVFVTARARARELEGFKSLGARGVITKPFSTKTLRDSLRSQLAVPAETQSEPGGTTTARATTRATATAVLAKECDAFRERLRFDRIELERLSEKTQTSLTADLVEELQSFAHKLAGVASFFGFEGVSQAASALEAATIRQTTDPGSAKLQDSMSALLACLEREQLCETPQQAGAANLKLLH